jgi:hypothetical protein
MRIAHSTQIVDKSTNVFLFVNMGWQYGIISEHHLMPRINKCCLFRASTVAFLQHGRETLHFSNTLVE